MGTANGRYTCVGTETFWHVTLASRLASIRQNGLRVGESRFEPLDYPEGVYLFSSPEAAIHFLYINEQAELDEYGEDQAEGFAIIEVHPHPGTVVLQDPFSDDASGLGRFSFYATCTIPTEYLSIPSVDLKTNTNAGGPAVDLS